MRVALFTETYLPYINGVVTHVKILKDGLERLGHTVLVVTADTNTMHHYIEDGVLHCPAARVKRIYNYGLASPYSHTRLKMIEDFRPDIIHIHNEFGVGISGVHIAKKLKIPLVYTLHTMYDEYVYYVAPRHLARVARSTSRRFTRYFANSAQALTGPSKKCEVYFRQVGVNKDVSVIPNAVELDAFIRSSIPPESVAAVRERFDIPKDALLACFVGRLGREKSVDILLDFWAESITAEDGIHLMIVGDGPCKHELEEQARNLGIDSMVTFTGAVEHADLPPYVAACDVYATASLSDTNSISMLEGMAAGLPVLQRYDALNANQVREGENGFIFNTPAEFGEKLKRMKNMSNDELAAFRERVTRSVLNSGAEDLANYTLMVYHKLYQEQK